MLRAVGTSRAWVVTGAGVFRVAACLSPGGLAGAGEQGESVAEQVQGGYRLVRVPEPVMRQPPVQVPGAGIDLADQIVR